MKPSRLLTIVVQGLIACHEMNWQSVPAWWQTVRTEVTDVFNFRNRAELYKRLQWLHDTALLKVSYFIDRVLISSFLSVLKTWKESCIVWVSEPRQSFCQTGLAILARMGNTMVKFSLYVQWTSSNPYYEDSLGYKCCLEKSPGAFTITHWALINYPFWRQVSTLT